MKRSKMIKHIADAIILNEVYGYKNATTQADMILRVLEAHGMLPPPKRGKVKIESDKNGLIIPVWSWEPEDETQ